MVAKFIQSKEGLALLIDPEFVRRLGLEEKMEAEISTDGHVLTVAPRRCINDQKFDHLLDQIEVEYDDVFKKLAE